MTEAKRPQKKHGRITPDKIERVVGALQVGADMALAAGLIGVTREALRLYGKKYPDVQARFDEARYRADDVIVKRLYDKAKDGDVTSMIFWLKNRRGDEWRDRRDLTLSGGAPVQLKWLDEPEKAEDDGSDSA